MYGQTERNRHIRATRVFETSDAREGDEGAPRETREAGMGVITDRILRRE